MYCVRLVAEKMRDLYLVSPLINVKWTVKNVYILHNQIEALLAQRKR
jgi:hypothetical protein